jgi:hypothetical protein
MTLAAFRDQLLASLSNAYKKYLGAIHELPLIFLLISKLKRRITPFIA